MTLRSDDFAALPVGIVYGDPIAETRCECAPPATSLPWKKTLSGPGRRTHTTDTQEMVLTGTRAS